MLKGQDHDTYRFNSAAYFNGLGLALCVITTLMFVLIHYGASGGRRDPDPLVANGFLGSLFVLGVMLMLAQKRIEVRPAEGTIHIRQGIWPFLKPKEMTLALAEKLDVSTFPMRSGHGYRAILRYSDERSLLLAKSSSADDLASAVGLARQLGLPILVSRNVSSNDRLWADLGLDAEGDRAPA